MNSHYDYLEKYLTPFINRLGIQGDHDGLINAHGDKCYQYQDKWVVGGLTFNRGVAIYMLTRIAPWMHEVRETSNGWVDPWKWVVQNQDRFIPILVDLEKQV